jgi:hypothetical protein
MTMDMPEYKNYEINSEWRHAHIYNIREYKENNFY